MMLAWAFKSGRFDVQLHIEHDFNYKYDGDDEDGEIQRALDEDRYCAFDSTVLVKLDGIVVGRDDLGGSVYDARKVSEFWTAHRDADPMNRNCTAYRAVHGQRSVICHYFPDMVRMACANARATLHNMPKVHAA